FTNLFRGRPHEDFEATVTTRSGTRLFWRFTGTASGSLEDGRRYAVMMALDLTDRLEKEQALEEATIFLRRTLDSLNLFAGVCTPDGTLIQVNRAALELAHLEVSDVLGKPLEETFWWKGRPEVQAELRQAINRAAVGKASRLDLELRLGDGQLATYDFQI